MILCATVGFENTICIRNQLQCERTNLNRSALEKLACKTKECYGRFKHECGTYCSVNKEKCSIFRSFSNKIFRSLVSPNYHMNFKKYTRNLRAIKACPQYKWNPKDVCFRNKSCSFERHFSYLNINFMKKMYCPCSNTHNQYCINNYCVNNKNACGTLSRIVNKNIFNFKKCN